MFIVPSNDLSHYNGAFTNENTKVTWMSGVNYNSQENIDGQLYMAAYQYPKIFSFDTVTHEFDFYDLDIQGVDPADEVMTIAFDLDEDGEVDGYDPDSDPPGEPIVQMSCPSWFFNTDDGWQDAYFHESNCKIVSKENWVVLAWYDGAKLQAAYFEGNYAPEFEDMLPVSISFGDELEVLSNDPGNYHAKLHFLFMDDEDYGSASGETAGGGDLTNSAIRYAAIDLKFQEETSSDDVTITPTAELLSQNYPNPFNP
ncbi:MAG: hypothetical protein P9L95_02690, partial [Candidatus Tenebribacter mawsonii]|nr:hypothetical protein [Candidatus Tenebribacter mawsonii]